MPWLVCFPRENKSKLFLLLATSFRTMSSSDGSDSDEDTAVPEPEGGWVRLTVRDFAHYPSSIPRDAFRGRDDIIEIEIPAHIRCIGEYAFLQCRNVKTVQLPKHLQVIGHSSFQGCVRLVEINFPGSVIEIGSCAFEDCGKLSVVTFPHELKHTIKGFGHCVFVGCPLLPVQIKSGWKPTGEFAAADLAHYGSTTAIPTEAFFMRLDIRSIVLPARVTEIGVATFYECFNLKTVHFPPRLRVIQAHAFQSCMSIEDVVLPESVQTVDERAFYRCGITLKSFVMLRSFNGRHLLTLGRDLFDSEDSDDDSDGISDGHDHGGDQDGRAGVDAGNITAGDEKGVQLRPRPNRNRRDAVVSAPDSVITRFTQRRYNSHDDAPGATRDKASALQLKHYFWSISGHRSLTPSQQRFVFTVIMCGSRDDSLPDELLVHILGFLPSNTLHLLLCVARA